MDFDIQLDERGRLKLPESLREALDTSPEICFHLTLRANTLVLHRSPRTQTKPPAPASANPTMRKGRKAPHRHPKSETESM